jgi:hypothetical protein
MLLLLLPLLVLASLHHTSWILQRLKALQQQQ